MNAKAPHIEVTVSSFYLPERSQPELRRYVFGYTIRLTNHGSVSAQLLNRHWIITDAVGRVEEVRGKGVVGEQPLIKPGETFEYSSGCPLATPYGYMQGSYSMVDETGRPFEVEVPLFTLGNPEGRTLN